MLVDLGDQTVCAALGSRPRHGVQHLRTMAVLQHLGRADKRDMRHIPPRREQDLSDGSLAAGPGDEGVGGASGAKHVEQGILQHIRPSSERQLRIEAQPAITDPMQER